MTDHNDDPKSPTGNFIANTSCIFGSFFFAIFSTLVTAFVVIKILGWLGVI